MSEGKDFAPRGMCPYCGENVPVEGALTTRHTVGAIDTRQVCPGSGQNVRCAESDARPLWNGEPNRRFRG